MKEARESGLFCLLLGLGIYTCYLVCMAAMHRERSIGVVWLPTTYQSSEF
jgi:hypothetical protein